MSSSRAGSSGSSSAEPDWAHLGPAVSPHGGPEAEAPDAARAQAPRGTDEAAPGQVDSADAPTRPRSAGSHSSAESRGPDADARARPGSSGGSGRVGVLGALTRVLVALALPLSLLVVSIRLVATPLFLWIEYHRPGFPEDAYGFEAEDRMTLGSHGMDYILNWAPEPFLGEVRSPSGRPWFTADEISHMTDVKWVMQIGLWAGTVVVVLALVLALLRRRDRDGLLGAVAVGGWLTVIATALLAVVAAVAWQQFFAAFHSLFFSEGTWTFSMSDTLIRLYPTQFWIDAAAVIAVIVLGGSVLAAVLAQRARTPRKAPARGRRRA